MSAPAIKHLHIGTGALGLGLICPTTSRAGMNVIVANRRAPRSAPRNSALLSALGYDLQKADGIERVQLAEVILFEESDTELLVEAICDPGLVLLTIALGDGVTAICDILAAALGERVRRSVSQKLCIVACENAIDSSQLRQQVFKNFDTTESALIDAHVSFASCVVDRICREPRVVGGRVVAVTEDYGKWSIDGARLRISVAGAPGVDLSSLLMSAERNNVVSIVDDIAVEKKKKLLLVNGPHILLSILAADAEMLSIKEFLASPGGRDVDIRLMTEFKKILLHSEPSLSEAELNKLTDQIVPRFRNSDESIYRVLKRFQPHRLEEFYKSMYQKVVDHALAFIEGPARGTLPLISHCVMISIRLVGSGIFPAPDFTGPTGLQLVDQ